MYRVTIIIQLFDIAALFIIEIMQMDFDALVMQRPDLSVHVDSAAIVKWVRSVKADNM